MTYQKVFTISAPGVDAASCDLYTPRYQIPSGIISTLLVEAGVTPSSYQKTTSEHCWRITVSDADKLKAYMQKEFPSAEDLGTWVTKRKAAYTASKAASVVIPGPGFSYPWSPLTPSTGRPSI